MISLKTILTRSKADLEGAIKDPYKYDIKDYLEGRLAEVAYLLEFIDLHNENLQIN